MASRRALCTCTAAVLATAVLPSCARAPVLGPEAERAQVSGDYPSLLPLDEIIAQAEARPPGDPTADAELQARAARLRQRAAALEGPVLDEASRRRLERAATE